MKEKIVLSVFLSLLMLLAISPRTSVGAHTQDAPQVVPLYAGQHMLVGEVLVWNNETYLYVEYNITEPGWYLVETHLEVATDLDNIPQTKKKTTQYPGTSPIKTNPTSLGRLSIRT